jgi:cytochrome c oxidase accessory protein FixG
MAINFDIKDPAGTFRDTIATIDKEGNRKWIFPKKPGGKYYNARTIVSILLLTLLFAGPFIRIGGEPLLMMNVILRKFVLFGQVFWPQDFYLFGLGMITFLVFVIVFTVAFGRVFCGWICPQTIFMEMVFRKIEYLIEGDWKQQLALDKMEWNTEKIRKKTLKHVTFYFISFLIANTFLAYIIGSNELIKIITDDPSEHIAGLSSVLVFSAVFYGVFAKFREQACLVVCPYGRLQGVLLDRNSIVVAYDRLRGEGRAKFHKNENRSSAGKGDCIDCHHCVDVCPTGIDIRNGTQLECVNCTACIDACNHMMSSIGHKPGLIRYASETEIADRKPFRITTRMKAYSTVLLLLIGAMTTLLITRSDISGTLLRATGMLYQEQEAGKISNLYYYKIINKTNKTIPVKLKPLDAGIEIKLIGNQDIIIDEQGIGQGALFIYVNKTDLTKMKSKFTIGVYSGDELIYKLKTTFIGPVTLIKKS